MKDVKLGSHQSEESRAKLSAFHLGLKMLPETREKISVALAGNTNALGHRWSEEDKTRLSVDAIGRPMSPETRAKISMAMMGHIIYPEATAKAAAKHWKGGQRMACTRTRAKRRILGSIPLNAPFVGCDGHHLDMERVIFIPRVLHRSIWHNQWTGHNMEQINVLALQWLAQNPN